MGSCCSSGAQDGSNARPSVSSNTQTRQMMNASTAGASTAGRQSTTQTTGGRPFKPRRDGTWTSDVPITRSELHRRRTEFWETAPQYDGLAETWNSLRVAVELSHQNDLPTAQAVLDSAGITIPTGDLGNGCYDELGHRFVIPEFVLSDPSNIQDDEVIAKPRDSSSTAVMKREIESESLNEEETMYMVEPPLPATMSDFGKVKVRMSNTARDIGVPFKRADNVVDVKKRLMEQTGVKGEVKLFMFGKPLREDTPLVKQGWDDHIIQAFIRE